MLCVIPIIHRRISSFILSEKGSMPHQSILSLGTFLTGAVIGGILASKHAVAQHVNGVGFANADSQITVTHQHHQSGSPTTSGTTAQHISGTTGTTSTTGTTY